MASAGSVRVQLTEARWLNPALRVLGAGARVANKLNSLVLGRAVLATADAALRLGVTAKAVDEPSPPRAGAGLVCGGGPKAG